MSIAGESKYHVELADAAYWRRQIKCQDACPVHTDARGYVRAIAAGQYRRAYLIARGPNPFASICGRICGAPCEAACRRGDLDAPIAIRALKRFATERFGPETLLAEVGAADYRSEYVDRAGSAVCDAIDEIQHLLQAVRAPSWKKPEGGPVAIIGAGPAGLSCAHDLALMGVRSVVFEIEPKPAGMLYYGVPEYRLPRDLIAAEIALIEALGVEIRCSTEVGKDISLDELLRNYAALVIAVGAKRSRALQLEGAQGPGVLGGVDFLRAVSLGSPPTLGKRVLVIGGGNVAYDVARTSLRQTYFDAARSAARQPDVGEVHLACLESREEMPADEVEVREGDEEGIVRHHRLGPMRIVRDDRGRVTGVEFKKVLRVFDESRRFSPQFDDSAREVVKADTVILAVGQAADLGFVTSAGAGVEVSDRGVIRLDAATLGTTNPKVFAAGDVAHGTRLMIDAIASGKKAARSVYHLLTGRTIETSVVQLHTPIDGYGREKDYEKQPRLEIPAAPVADRLAHPGAQVERGYAEGAARCEAGRCFDCGVNTIFDGDKCILCGGCADVCPTLCLKLVPVTDIVGPGELETAIEGSFGEGDWSANSAIIKDETLCIRCANCAMRCPTGAITMERFAFGEKWQ